MTVERDGCGSIHYFARVVGTHEMGARYSVELIDHTARICDDIVAHVWEANVRSGYGFCGTSDATMRLVGNPEPLFTIASTN